MKSTAAGARTAIRSCYSPSPGKLSQSIPQSVQRNSSLRPLLYRGHGINFQINSYHCIQNWISPERNRSAEVRYSNPCMVPRGR